MIIVEDNTGKVDANSYGSVDEADEYFTDRLNTTWLTADYQLKEVVLIKATDYIEIRFADKFKSTRLYPDNPQALSFPRVDYIVTPVNVKRATFEYALRALSGELSADVAVQQNVNTVTKRKVGSIETIDEISYPANHKRVDSFARYIVPDGLIKPFLKGGSNGVIRQ